MENETRRLIGWRIRREQWSRRRRSSDCRRRQRYGGGWQAEYIAAFEAAKEALYLKRLGCDFKALSENHCVVLHDDSQACIRIAGNPCLAERTKHFDIKYHWLREKVKANQVKLTYINTNEQLADIFTKPLGFMQHHYLRGKLTGYR